VSRSITAWALTSAVTKELDRGSFCSLKRVNSTNILDERLGIGGKVTTRDSGNEIGT
jgi:hypothetical protein